ncbi:MAG TPA: isochorismatase family cysteine hydrolase [Thermomicrobiales bacterium]|nr:isochorismatase family cysteine hydrolase [Thermomicrobiales bacterium]
MIDQDRSLSVDARPGPMQLDPRDTAVIVVDMQHGFVGDGGWWDRAGVDLSGIQAAVDPISRVLEMARGAGMAVIYLMMDLEGADERRSPRLSRYFEHVRRDIPISFGRVAGMRESDILPAIAPEPGEIVIEKSRHSGFFDTDLDIRLEAHGITTLVFTGCTTSVCVESTLRDAFFRDYRCLLLEDCVAEPLGAGNHEATLRLVEFLYGWVGLSGDFERALRLADASLVRG